MEFSSAGSFIATKEHRRFVEFANAVRKHRYIGLCYGRAGVGKTLSARRYAKWNESLLKITLWSRGPSELKVYAALAQSRSAFYTPTVGCTLRETKKELTALMSYIGICIELGLEIKESGTLKKHRPPLGESQRNLQLLIIDEAERLSTTTLEYLRDVFDRLEIGLILIGMPGFEKRMSRYPQLYSRVGFAHQYRPLQNEELTFVLTRRCSGSASTIPTSLTPKRSPLSSVSPVEISASSSGSSSRLSES